MKPGTYVSVYGHLGIVTGFYRTAKGKDQVGVFFHGSGDTMLYPPRFLRKKTVELVPVPKP